MTLTGLRYVARTWISSRERLYFPLYRLFRTRRDGLLNDHTAITIEGFPRSANSFAQRAFELANPGVEVAHHTHAVAQVVGSVRRGLPTIVLIREPESAIRSLLVQRPGIGSRAAAWSYVNFYRRLLPHRSAFLLVPFEDATRDMGDIIGRVNRRFGSAFRRFEHNRENVEAVFRQMDDAHTAHWGVIRETRLARPLDARNELKGRIDLAESGHWLDEARALYRAYMDRESATSS